MPTPSEAPDPPARATPSGPARDGERGRGRTARQAVEGTEDPPRRRVSSRVGEPGSAPGVRARVRGELTRQIVAVARRQLATEGAAGLSLRAVARELGMVSSAVYRYVANRDELLTLLIVDAYDALGDTVERAEGKVARDDVEARYLAICHAARRWALKNPHEWALIYGSPVPGYAAPEATVEPAGRLGRVLIGVLADAVARGAADPRPGDPLPERARRAMEPSRAFFPAEIPDELVLAGLSMWTHLTGTISFELFGHWHDVVADPAALRAAYFAEEMTRLARRFGLVPVD
jgi:AcrR family transcriptional regulator